jgi:hypothetical protein
MPKKYFCENLIDLEPCGEDDPENFSTGRYNRCRKCRNLDNKKYMQHLKELTVRENMEERTQDLKDGKKFQLLVEAIIKGKSFTDEGLTLPEDSIFTRNKINTVSNICFENNQKMIKEIEKLKRENEYLREKTEKNEIEIIKFKTILEEKLNLKFN